MLTKSYRGSAEEGGEGDKLAPRARGIYTSTEHCLNTKDTRGQTTSLFNYNHILSIIPHYLSTAICLPPIARLRRHPPSRESQTGRYVPLSLIRLRVMPTYGQLEQTAR